MYNEAMKLLHTFLWLVLNLALLTLGSASWAAPWLDCSMPHGTAAHLSASPSATQAKHADGSSSARHHQHHHHAQPHPTAGHDAGDAHVSMGDSDHGKTSSSCKNSPCCQPLVALTGPTLGSWRFSTPITPSGIDPEPPSLTRASIWRPPRRTPLQFS